jgi:hypothetical protein
MCERLTEIASHFHIGTVSRFVNAHASHLCMAVLSGGGVGLQTTEAQDMKKHWLEVAHCHV